MNHTSRKTHKVLTALLVLLLLLTLLSCDAGGGAEAGGTPAESTSPRESERDTEGAFAPPMTCNAVTFRSSSLFDSRHGINTKLTLDAQYFEIGAPLAGDLYAKNKTDARIEGYVHVYYEWTENGESHTSFGAPYAEGELPTYMTKQIALLSDQSFFWDLSMKIGTELLADTAHSFVLHIVVSRDTEPGTEGQIYDYAIPFDVLTLTESSGKGMPVQLANVETPWYIEAWEAENLPELPSETPSLAVKTPLVYETESHGIAFKVEFFREYYVIGAPIQVQLTMTNKTDSDFTFRSNGVFPGWFECAGENPSSLYFDPQYLPSKHESEHYTDSYYLVEAIYELTIPAEEALTLEYAYIAEEAFFAREGVYMFKVWLNGSFEIDSFLAIPLEIVEVELTAEG